MCYKCVLPVSHVSSGGSTGQLAELYFSQLEVGTVTRLYNLYQHDFLMFGYSPHKYLSLARQ